MFLYIRIGFAFSAFIGSFNDSSSMQSIGLTAGVVLLLFCFLVVTIFVSARYFIGIRPEWGKVSWKSNPFRVSEPLHFFHFLSIFFLASGAGSICRYLFLSDIGIEKSYPVLAIGAGMLMAVVVLDRVIHKVQQKFKART
jgi:hypothetical protein